MYLGKTNKQTKNEERIRKELNRLHPPSTSTIEGFANALIKSKIYQHIAETLKELGGYTVEEIRQYQDHAEIDISEVPFLPLSVHDKVKLSELFSPDLDNFYITKENKWTYLFKEKEKTGFEEAKAKINFNMTNRAKNSKLIKIIAEVMGSSENEQFVRL